MYKKFYVAGLEPAPPGNYSRERRGFKSRYVKTFICFLNKYFSFLSGITLSKCQKYI